MRVIARDMDWELRFQVVDGARVRYAVAGEGPAVVLVHGLGACLASWWENIGPLSKHFRVYALDMPSHGESEPLPGVDHDAVKSARFLTHFLDAMSVPRASLVGNSAGGLVTAMCALNHPERVERLVLVDSAGLGRPVSWFLRIASLPLAGGILHLRTVPSNQAVMRELFYRPQQIGDALAAELLRARNRQHTRSAMVRVLRNGVTLLGVRRAMRILDRLAQVQAPTLIVWGREDRVLPVSHAHEAARVLPQARVEVFPECGHWPQMEKAEQFNRLMVEFLAPVHEGKAAPGG
ncbi:MAG: alpha/beta fold hydrolase [Chloroflexota bacterium]|nr:alpha/beta fold hydrolase [Chloroflexota bacterium]